MRPVATCPPHSYIISRVVPAPRGDVDPDVGRKSVGDGTGDCHLWWPHWPAGGDDDGWCRGGTEWIIWPIVRVACDANSVSLGTTELRIGDANARDEPSITGAFMQRISDFSKLDYSSYRLIGSVNFLRGRARSSPLFGNGGSRSFREKKWP